MMFTVAVDTATMDTRGRAAPGGAATSPESAMASELFDQFVSAGTFKAVLSTYRHLCEVLHLKPNNISNFYPRLKAKLHSWKAASLWAKLDKRASHKCYNRGKSCPNTRVLIIGAGPCGLRAAIEIQLLGAKVVVLEKRDRFSRNNVLHLWPFVIHDLRGLGAKKFFGKFCAGSIDHISIRQLQLILLKVALLLGVEVHENVGFKSLKDPPDDQSHERIGWHASVIPADHPVSQYEFDVLIGADGKRNTLLGFNRKEFRGKLAIAVTANFINRHTLEEARVPEISGVAFIFNQKFFQDMREQTAIDLENIVYYKDDTHYFVMTAKKQSLLDRGVILNDYNDTARLLAAENVDREALMEYARDAADFATNYQLPSLDFAVNHYGQADVAMFDFTSMYAAENACRIVERKGHKLLQGLVGDSLLEPFWPTGSGCARGFLSSFDIGWMVRSWASGKLTQLQVLAEREAIYRLLAQTTPENLSKDMNQYTLNPSSRYPNLNLHAVLPSQVRSLYDTDGNVEDQILDIAVEVPKKKRRRESIIHPDALLNWCQRQVALHDSIKIENLTSSWKNGLALCAILHRYRPDLIDLGALHSGDVAKNNQLAFDICERELGIPPVMTGQEMAECEIPDKLSMVSYISQIYETFRGEIPVVCPPKAVINEECPASPNRQSHATPLSILAKISNKLQNKRKYSIEKEAVKEKERGDTLKRSRTPSTLINRRRSKEKDKGIALDLVSRDVALTNFKTIPVNAPKESINSRVKNLEEKMKRDAGLRCHLSETTESSKSTSRVRTEPTDLSIKLIQEQLKKNGNEINAKKPTGPKVGRLRKDEWNVKMLEEKIKQQQKSLQKISGAEKSKVMQEIFDNKLRLIDAKLKAGGALTPEEQARFEKFDSSLNKLNKQLTKGNLETGERGHNQVAAMTEHMTTIWDKKVGHKKDPLPPPPVISSSPRPESSANLGGSEICYFCQKRVYLMERLSAEGLFFHRSCFKCEYCGASLRLGNYSFDRTGVCGGKFYCRPHFRMQKPDHRWQEMMKRKQAFLSCAFDEQEKEKIYSTILANAEKALSPGKQLTVDQKADISATDSPVSTSIGKNKDNKVLEMKSPNLLMEPVITTFGRDQTPERVEYENSIMELSEEELLTSELEEEELTQKNLGPSQELATSDDEYSDLSTDTESDEEAFAEELERSLTADETRKLAETWQRRYSREHSLVDSGASSSADDEGSDTEIGSEDGTSDDIDSDAEYSLGHSDDEDIIPKNIQLEKEDQESKIPESKDGLMVQVPVIDLKGMKHESEEETSTESDVSEELSESECSGDETGTEVDSESEPEPQLPPPQIPTIVIEESPPQDIDQDQEWGEDTKQIAKTCVSIEDEVKSVTNNCHPSVEVGVNSETHSVEPDVDIDFHQSNECHEVVKADHVLTNSSVTVPDNESIIIVEPTEVLTNMIDEIGHIPETMDEVSSFQSTCDKDGKLFLLADKDTHSESSICRHEIIKESNVPNKSSHETEEKCIEIQRQNSNMHKPCTLVPECKETENAFDNDSVCSVTAVATEIVNEVLETAQQSLSNNLQIESHPSNIPINVFHTKIIAQDILSDSSPCTEDTSSASGSVGWNILRSQKSSEDSDIPLMELASPLVEEKEFMNDASPSKIFSGPSVLNAGNNILNSTNQTINSKYDSKGLLLPSSQFEEIVLQNLGYKVLDNKDDISEVRECKDYVTDMHPSEHIENLQISCIDSLSEESSGSIPCSSPDFEYNQVTVAKTIDTSNESDVSPLLDEINKSDNEASIYVNQNDSITEENINFDINPAYITIRDRKQPSHNDNFSWDSDNSISVPWFAEETDTVSVDFGQNIAQPLEDGIYRALLVQSVDGDDVMEDRRGIEDTNIILKNSEEYSNNIKENKKTISSALNFSLSPSQELNTNSSPIKCQTVSKLPLEKHSYSDFQHSTPLSSQQTEQLAAPLQFLEKAKYFKELNNASETVIQQALENNDKAKDLQNIGTVCCNHSLEPANEQMKGDVLQSLTTHEIRNKKEICSKDRINQVGSTLSVLKSEAPSVNHSDYILGSFSYHSPTNITKNNSTSNYIPEQSPVQKLRQQRSEENTPTPEAKFRGYSGSFAEKVRPRSLVGDTLYLRSLDINLQKVQFPSLTKSTDKLDEADKNSMLQEEEQETNKQDSDSLEAEDNFPIIELPNVQSTLASSDHCNNTNINTKKMGNESTSSPVVQQKNTETFSGKILSFVPSQSSSTMSTKPQLSVCNMNPNHKYAAINMEKQKCSQLVNASVSPIPQDKHSDPISPYIYAQTRPFAENSFPVKMRPKGDMDLAKLRQKREKRKSVHEDIQGLPFADEEKQSAVGDIVISSEDVFDSPLLPIRNNMQYQTSYSVKDGSIPILQTPDQGDQDIYIRTQRTVEQEKARKEARARARLKSDEELGLSPNNYRKKYHRQLSLNSIHYEELYADDFFDKDDEDLEDEIIDGTFHAKRVEIVEPQDNMLDAKAPLQKKPSPQSSEESASHHSVISPSFSSSVPSSDKTVSALTNTSTSKTDGANYLESSLSVDEVKINVSPVTGKLFQLPNASTPSNKTSSSETSPDTRDYETPPSNLKLKSKFKNKLAQHSETSGDEEKVKSNGKKSFFSILNFGKNNASKEKSKLRSKEVDKERSASLPADLSAKTPPKHRPFAHLKLPKSKEKIKDKQRRKYIPSDCQDISVAPNISSESIPEAHHEDLSSSLLSSSQLKVIPKYTVYRVPDMKSAAFPIHLPIHRVENGLAPKASEDSFSDTEEDTQGSRAHGSISNTEKKDKNSTDKEKKAQRVVFKVQRQQELKRLRTAQEIQRRLEELEVQQKELEQQGVKVEKILRGEGQGTQHSRGETELMQDWYSLIHAKNKLVREEQELLIRAKDLELEDRHSRLQQDMRERMAQSDSQKNSNEIEEERKILAEMLEIVEKRDELVAMLDQLRVREVEEDKNLESQMLSRGIELSPSDKS